MKQSELQYHAYLIRCWHVEPDSHPQQEAWRFSVEAADGQGKKRGFSDPEKLIAFIMEQMQTKMGHNL